MRIVPGDVVRATNGWSLSKLNEAFLGGSPWGMKLGNDLLVIAVHKEASDDGVPVICILTQTAGPVWINFDSRTVMVNGRK